MSRAGRTLSFLFGGNQNMHQGKKGFRIPQQNQQSERKGFAVVSPAAVGAVTALFSVPTSTVTILVDVASCVVSSLIVDGVVEDECCVLSSRGRLLMDRHLLFVLGRLITLLRGCSSTSRGRALGLLNCRHLEQSLHLVSNASRLGVRRFGHIA